MLYLYFSIFYLKLASSASFLAELTDGRAPTVSELLNSPAPSVSEPPNDLAPLLAEFPDAAPTIEVIPSLNSLIIF